MTRDRLDNSPQNVTAQSGVTFFQLYEKNFPYPYDSNPPKGHCYQCLGQL